MTWIGKILAVLVLVLAVAGMWFSVSVFVARTNWKTDRDAYKKLYDEAKTARNTELESYRSEKDALERQLLAEKTKNQGLAERVAELQGKNDAVVKNVLELTQQLKQVNLNEQTQAAIVVAMTEELKETRKRNDALEGERVRLVTAKENAEKDRQTAENIAKQATADKLLADTRIERLIAELADARATGGSASASVLNSFGKAPQPLPDGIRGTVTAYKDGYVALSIGLDAGLSNGAVLDVFRSEGGGQYLGTIVIERVHPKDAVATFKPANPLRTVAKLRPEELPKVGDTVGKIGNAPISLKP